MANFTVNDHQIVNDISENEVFLNFQKADFDSVWGDFSSDSLSDSDQVLFEEPVTSTSSEASLWKELEKIQPIITYPNNNMEITSRTAQDSIVFGGDSFDRIFNNGLLKNTQNDPMVSSSFDLGTPQHPFEEVLSLPEDTIDSENDISSPRSVIYYPSSPDGEEVAEDAVSDHASKAYSSPPPTGYPNSIHSYSQLPVTNNKENIDFSDDVIIEEETVESNDASGETQTSDMVKDKTLSIQNLSPFKSRNRRRQRKPRVFRVTLTQAPSKISPKKKTFANGKAKLYTQKPLNDPEAEKARQNAINAKKNRELKKKERDMFAKQVVSLKEENITLKKSAAAMRKRASDAEAELRRLQAAIRANQLVDILKAAGNKNKESDKISVYNINDNMDTDLESLW